MRARGGRVVGAVALVALALGGGATGCGDGIGGWFGSECADVDCAAGGVVVSWEAGALAPGVTARVCVEDDCARDGSRLDPGGAGGAAFTRGRPEHAAARLEVIDDHGQVVATYRGEGDRTGGPCCGSVRLRVDGDRLVPDEPDEGA